MKEKADPFTLVVREALETNPILGQGVTSHYGNWDVGEFIHKRGMDFFQGNVVKYVDRFKRKDGKKDLLKARDYIDKLIEFNYKDQ